MNRAVLLSAALLPLLGFACASAGPRRGPTLAQEVVAIGRENHGAMVAVAYEELDGRAAYQVREHEIFHAASTMKIPVMVAAYQAVERGELRLDRPVPVVDEFRSLMDGSPYKLKAEDDGDPELYREVGKSRTVADLIRRMITRSSNLATNLLLDRLGASQINDSMRQLGAMDGHVLRGVQDDKAFAARMNNTLSARDLQVLLRALAVGGDAFSESSRTAMLDLLKAQEFNEKIPAGLPPGIPVAHKTGDVTGVHHDAAIVYPPGEHPYILVVLTAGIADPKRADQAIARLSRAVWEGRRRPLPRR
jgi:beta-lactamase class A